MNSKSQDVCHSLTSPEMTQGILWIVFDRFIANVCPLGLAEPMQTYITACRYKKHQTFSLKFLLVLYPQKCIATAQCFFFHPLIATVSHPKWNSKNERKKRDLRSTKLFNTGTRMYSFLRAFIWVVIPSGNVIELEDSSRLPGCRLLLRAWANIYLKAYIPSDGLGIYG